MASVSYVGNNPQVPIVAHESYIPDQLIAGHFNIVTDSVVIGGGALLKRGSLMGVANVAAPVTSTGTVAGSGTVLVAALPAAGDTLTVQGTAITFVAADPVGNQVLIGFPQEETIDAPTTAQLIAQTALNLAGFLIGSADVNLSKLSYSFNAGTNTITATANVLGTAGNAYTLATSNAAAFTLSGATLAGGAANTGTATIGSVTTGAKVQQGAYKAVCTSATAGNVFDPNGVEIGQFTMGTAFKDAEINFTITTGGAPAAGDSFQLFVTPTTSPVYVLANAGATDGSAVPSAVLLDDADASGGNVTGVVALTGEFNANAVRFGAGFNATNAKTALALRSIYLKFTISAADPV